jgi:hypothetical protein
MMGSEESYNPYHSLHDAPNATHCPLDSDMLSTSGTRAVSSPQFAKKNRAWVLLILPTIFLSIIAALFGIMLLWLLYHRVKFDQASVTNGALISDEGARWCQLLNMVSSANCDQLKQNMLGLTLSGLLVSSAICATIQ